MRRDLAALIAAVGLASASQTVFSIHDDIDAFPQYSIVFSPTPISPSEAAEFLEPPKASNGADSIAIPLEYTRLLLHSTPHLCSIPRPPREERNLTSEALHKASLALELSRANTHGWELLSPLDKSCLYYTSGWWSYKFCYNDSITQFHAAPPQAGRPQFPPVRDPRTPQFVLGRSKKIPGQDSKTHGKFYDDGTNKKEKADSGSDLEVRGSQEHSDHHEDEEIQGILQDNGDNRYLSQKMKSGTLCDLTMRPREIEIQYHCGASGNDRIAWIKEITTCSYLMVVHTPRLCSDVAFQPQAQADTHEILCKPIMGEEGTESSATDSAPQEPARSGEAVTTSDNAADILKSLAKENAKDKPLIIGGTVVGGGEYFPASDPPLLKPPSFWNTNILSNKKPVMIAKSDTKVTPGSGKGGNAAAKVPGTPNSEKLAASVNARLKSDGEVAIEILAHGQGQNDGYHIMNDEDLAKVGMSPAVVEGLAEKLRAAAGSNTWTLALVEGQGVDGREVRGVIDAPGTDSGSQTAATEWAWEDVEELLFGQKAEDKTTEWKKREEKGKTTDNLKKGEGNAKGQQKKDGDDEEEGSEEIYYKDEL